MSKSYTVNGKQMFNKCIRKACENEPSVILEVNNAPIYKLFGIIENLQNASDIILIYNIESDEFLDIGNFGEVIRQKEKIELLNRRFQYELQEFGIQENLMFGYPISTKLLNSGILKIFVNVGVKHSSNIGYFIYPNKEYRVIIADTTSDDEICNVIQYLPNEESGNNLIDTLKFKISSSGRQCTSDIIDLVSSSISVNSCTVEDIFNRSLYAINKHHINSNIRQQRMLTSLNKAELKFQSDGVDSLVSILLKYGIAYLADSVGLGKTIIALRLLAKTRYKALVITPSEIVMNQWKEYIYEPNEIFENDVDIHFCLNSYQDLEKFSKLNRDYDIVIFDEAQNFRNMNTLRYKKAQEVCAGKLILLLGATPINNSITDIESQIMLGLNPSKSYDFGVGPVGEFFQSLKKSTNKSKKQSSEYKAAQKQAGNRVRKAIISKIMVRRTRADIEKYYKQDIESGKLHFPKVNEPKIVKYQYSGIKLARTLDILSGYNYSLQLTYALYNPSRYLKKTGVVENSVESVESEDTARELNMTGLTKVRLIKMLDSSPEAFIVSILNMVDAIDNRIAFLNSRGDDEQQSLFCEEDDTKLGKSSQYDKKRYIADLNNDKTVLLEILSYWYKDGVIIDGDVKVNKLREIIDTNPGRKMVIFTEFVTTASSLHRRLSELGYKVLKIDGIDSRSKTRELMDNFSLSGRMRNDYDILVSTNVLSEGINMNRASIAVNYDITWNPMIITQRVGRLNRIDSIIREIDVYNFFPCDEMDTAILSESNIISKYALASYSIGTDENYLVSSDDDNDISMMEYKSTIVESISKGIAEEQLDFRTVDFRYAEVANKVFDTSDKIKGLSDEILIKSVVANPDELPMTLMLLSESGKIITCAKDRTGFYYIDYNEYLDIVARHIVSSSDSYVVDCNQICDMYNTVKSRQLHFENSSESRAFYIVLSRYQSNLEKSLDNQDIDDVSYRRLYNILEAIKYNIRNCYLNAYLCKVYNNEIMTELKGSEIGTIEQIDLLLSRIIPKKFQSKHTEFSTNTNIKIISILDIIS